MLRIRKRLSPIVFGHGQIIEKNPAAVALKRQGLGLPLE
jgi:hypothetical protein